MLSLVPLTLHHPVDLKAIAEAQKGDTELLNLQISNNTLKLKKIEVPGSDVTLVCDTSMPRPRLFVPASEQRRVFDALHGLSHPGSRATARLISTHFVWPRVQSGCRTWARASLSCQRSKITKHNSSPLHTSILTSLDHYPLQNRIVWPDSHRPFLSLGISMAYGINHCRRRHVSPFCWLDLSILFP
ncbi:integrase catalytic domain-containing protein [Trichonephila inaurata madagascariensis]|uniref:Integrase catalytic domain-containing protein n=1 Tax=Trichonephila inaurata madagascariensis TaxID=2747483 RepID=A0A8X6XV33_9ARAC|nr:integrase catalytic domain-containing protein [Trichonephila inaurata madagascariensis]